MDESPAKLLNYVDGRLCTPRDGRYLDVHEPAVGQCFARCPDSTADDVDAAVHAAAGAFPAWSATAAAQRAAVLNSIADGVEARLDEFAAAESRDSGKPVALARSLDIPRAIANVRFFAAAITQFSSEAHVMG
ncbi:MAG TPA: aldehyde dehydrogenase family protein, partial [Rudaea sp.]|nr:aldehyde dehydrogenase family protein [Rudaea sp.]